MMMITGVEHGGNNDAVSFPRGGPIYVPDMVSTTLTRVSNFESSVIQQLQNLHSLLNSNPTESDNNNNDNEEEDISVEELKIITDEELARQALEEAFNNDQNEDKDSDQLSNKEKMKKSNREIESTSYIAKVENFVKIKQKQEEEKAAARLHSFNGSSIRTNESALETERLTTLSSLGRVSNLNLLNLRGDDENVQVIYPEVILCVEVYNSKKTWVKTQEFLVLGCQLLTELKDKICCSTDQVMRNAGKYDPSGYFLIEDVFCNDLRDSVEAIDYSEPILNWLRDSKDEALEKWECIVSGEFQKQQKRLKALVGNAVVPSQLPSFRAVEMQKTRFCDLRFRVGAGYVYCHQGDCKHIMVVRDMRLIHPEDVQNRRVYPIITFQMKERLQKCSVCKIYKAEKVTVDDKWAAENPCYFCKNCYYMLHYDNGSLLYEEFSVYDYIHE